MEWPKHHFLRDKPACECENVFHFVNHETRSMIQHPAPSFYLEPIFPGPVPISIFTAFQFLSQRLGQSSDHVTGELGGHL